MSITHKLPFSGITTGSLVMLLAASGCAFAGRQPTTSRRAKDDLQCVQEDHRVDPLSPLERRAQKAWQKTDESFQDGDAGVYVGGGSTSHNPAAASGSLGLFYMPTSWSTVRAGVMGLDSEGIGVGGIEGSARLHAPTRFTPYVGLSTDLGFNGLHSGISHNHSNSTRSPHAGDRISVASGMATIGPEAGISYWLTSSVRLNAGATYYIASNRSDFVLYGLSMEFVLFENLNAISNAGNTSSWLPGPDSRRYSYPDRYQTSTSEALSRPYFGASIESKEFQFSEDQNIDDPTDGNSDIPIAGVELNSGASNHKPEIDALFQPLSHFFSPDSRQSPQSERL